MNVCKLNLNNFPKYNLENDRKQQFLSETSEKLNKIINIINTTEEKATKEDYNTWLLSYFIWNFEQKNDKILTDTDAIAQSVKEHQKENIDEFNRFKESIEKNNEETNSSLKEINSSIESINKFKEEAKALEGQFSEVIQKMKIIEESNTFHKQATKHRNTAMVFISCFAVLLLTIIFYIIPELNSINFAQTYQKMQASLSKASPESIKTTMYFEYIKSISQKLIITSISIYTLVSLLKNYNNNMHNYIINTHKNNALNALLILYDKVSSPEAREQILLQSLQIIFTHQESGYSGNNSEAANPNVVTNIIESLKKQ